MKTRDLEPSLNSGLPLCFFGAVSVTPKSGDLTPRSAVTKGRETSLQQFPDRLRSARHSPLVPKVIDHEQFIRGQQYLEALTPKPRL